MKKSIGKLAFALILLSAAFFGTAEPAHAYYCSDHWDPNCYFIGAISYGSAACCTYQCGDWQEIGLCWHGPES